MLKKINIIKIVCIYFFFYSFLFTSFKYTAFSQYQLLILYPSSFFFFLVFNTFIHTNINELNLKKIFLNTHVLIYFFLFFFVFCFYELVSVTNFFAFFYKKKTQFSNLQIIQGPGLIHGVSFSVISTLYVYFVLKLKNLKYNVFFFKKNNNFVFKNIAFFLTFCIIFVTGAYWAFYIDIWGNWFNSDPVELFLLLFIFLPIILIHNNNNTLFYLFFFTTIISGVIFLWLLRLGVFNSRHTNISFQKVKTQTPPFWVFYLTGIFFLFFNTTDKCLKNTVNFFFVNFRVNKIGYFYFFFINIILFLYYTILLTNYKNWIITFTINFIVLSWILGLVAKLVAGAIYAKKNLKFVKWFLFHFIFLFFFIVSFFFNNIISNVSNQPYVFFFFNNNFNHYKTTYIEDALIDINSKNKISIFFDKYKDIGMLKQKYLKMNLTNYEFIIKNLNKADSQTVVKTKTFNFYNYVLNSSVSIDEFFSNFLPNYSTYGRYNFINLNLEYDSTYVWFILMIYVFLLLVFF